MDIESLKTFIILSQTKSFTKTAEMQHIVQSTVSQRLQELEKYYGKRLFIRNNRQVELSQEGTLFLPYAQRIIDLAEESKNKIDTTIFYDSYLSIGSVDMIWRHTLHSIMEDFLILHPDIAIRAVTSYSDNITELLLDNIIEIGIVATPPRNSKFKVLPAFNDEIVFVASPKIKISQRTSVDVSELSNLPLIYADLGSNFSAWANKYLSSTPTFRMKIDIVTLTIPFLVKGIGPGFMMRSLVENELKNGTLISIPLTGKELPPIWQTYAVFDKAKINSPNIQKVLSVLNQYQ